MYTWHIPRQKQNIKLIIVDFCGVMTRGSYKDTCRWLAKEHPYDFDTLYKIVYHKHFVRALVEQITEAQSFRYAV